MKERGIAFQDWGVRAILAGLKTQTRRVIKNWPPKIRLPRTVRSDIPVLPRPVALPGIYQPESNPHGALSVRVQGELLGVKPDEFEWISPYGQPGDLLWVKCAWRELGSVQRADGRQPPKEMLSNANTIYRFEHPEDGPWRSPWFMSRHITPIVMPVTALRVERVQDISEADAVAEGTSGVNYIRGSRACSKPNYCFRHTWDSIHGPGAWERNDWVWVPQWDPVTP